MTVLAEQRNEWTSFTGREVVKNLDRIDLKILYELDRDSRASGAAIAKITKLTPETVRYRISRLEESGVIAKFHTVINLGRIGYAVHKVYLKLVPVHEKQIQEIIQALDAVPEIAWIARFDGGYDFAIGYRAGTLTELSAFLDNFFRRYGEFIARRSFAINVHSEYLSRDYLGSGEQQEKVSAVYTAPQAAIKLDTMNRHIISELGRDSRLSASEIAQSFKSPTGKTLSREAVLKRIKRLERDGVITGYRTLIDPSALGLLLYRVLLYLNPLSDEQTLRFLKRLRRESHAVFVCKVMAEWDYEWALEVESPAQYRAIVAELTNEFPTAIRDSQGLIVSSVNKFRFAQGL